MTVDLIDLMEAKGAEEIRVDLIDPNRPNPHVMSVDMQLYLEKDMGAIDYDPITVSPMLTFYKEHPEVIRKDHPEVINASVVGIGKAKEMYVICDGEHRWRSAQKAGLETIWCIVEFWTEKDSMAHFYKRQRIKGELDPLKEAALFQHEIQVNERSRREVIDLYNVPSMKYLRTRLAILRIGIDVVGLFYSQEDYPGILSISHLENLSRLPLGDQYKVAMLSLERNWTRDDIIDEIRRIKEGRGTRYSHASVEAPEEPPKARPTAAQRALHPNIDILLKTWQEDLLRLIKAEKDGIAHKRLVLIPPVATPTVSKFLREMVDKEVLDRFEMSREGRRGRPPTGYRLHVVVEERVEPVEETKTDAEIFMEYPKGEAKVDPIVIEPVEGRPEVKEAPESWKPEPKSEEKALKEQDRIDLKRSTPTVVTMDILISFMDKVLKLAVREGFDLKTKEKIDGRDPSQWLIDELSEDLDSFIISRDMKEPDIRTLAGMALRACQLDYRYGRGK